MESKKINQLATSVAPQTSDLTIIGDPVTGVSKKITLLQIADLFATTGTVSSVAVTETGDALTITGSPITTAGTINIGFAGAATQYVRGDGALADFPTSTGGGSSVSYYLNSSVSQGTIGGVAYRQLSKTPISGAGTDITASTNGYIASYLTDANDPALLEVPAGNFNCEFYFSVNSNNHNPYVYAELYKYDGTTFTLLGSNQAIPEYLTNGTTLSAYYFAIPVAVAALTITDRIAIRIYVNVDGRTVTLHTENNHLCQVVTTFSKGLTSLNNLTRQVQFLGTGTSGTDFNIVSSVATHTFNIPDASATNRGLITTGTQTIAGAKTFSSGVISSSFYAQGNGTQGGYLYLKQGTTPYSTLTGSNSITADGTKYIFFSDAGSSNGKIALFELGSLTNNTNRTFTLPDLSGTLALLEAENKFTLVNSFDQSINYKTDAVLVGISGYISQAYAKSGSGASSILSMKIADGSSVKNISLDFIGSAVSTPYSYLFPALSGTMALLEGTQTFTGFKTFSNNVNLNSQLFINGATGYGGGISFRQGIILSINDGGTTTEFPDANSIKYYVGQGSSAYKNFVFDVSNITLNATRTYTLPNATGTLALTSDLSAYLPLAGGTLTGALSGTSATFSNQVTINGPAADWAAIIQNTNSTSGYSYGLKVKAGTSAGTDATFVLQDYAGNEFLTARGNGRIGIGTSSPSKTLQVESGSTATGGQVWSHSGGTIYARLGVVNPGVDNNTEFGAQSNNGLNLLTANVTRIAITSGGNVGIGKTGTIVGLDVYYSNTDCINSRTDAAAGNARSIYTGWNSASATTSGNLAFNVTSNGNVTNSNNSYGSLSDIKLKENIVDASPKLDDLLKVRIVNYNLIGQESKQIGVIAQELEQVFPSMIEQYFDKDENGENLETTYKGVKYSVFVPMLIKAIQELNQKGQEQQAQIEELKQLIKNK
jgi:hypothetical protein